MPPRSILLAALAGATMALATLPIDLAGLAFLSAPFLLVAIEALPPGGRRLLRGATLGLVVGLVYDVAILHWAPDAIAAYGDRSKGAAWATGALLCVVSALPFALAGALTSGLGGMGRRAWWILPAALGVAFWMSPLLFPWSPAEVITPLLPYVQMAELGGSSLIVLLMTLSGCAALEGARSRRALPLLLALGALALPTGYGLWRMSAVERARGDAPALRVGLVQPGVDLTIGRDPAMRARRLESLRLQSVTLEAAGAELIVWPESAYPYPIARERTRDLPGHLGVRDGRLHRPILFGAITRAGDCRDWNTIVAMDEEGAFEFVDKVGLMPFAETRPLASLGASRGGGERCDGHLRGAGPRVVEIAGARLGILNCYEDVDAQFPALLSADRPELLVNSSNDAWFGRGLFPHLHHGVARLRAIESRRDMVRSVNAGISAHVDANGVERWRSSSREATESVVEVRLLGGRTLYHRVGDWPAWLALLMLAAVGLSGRARGS